MLRSICTFTAQRLCFYCAVKHLTVRRGGEGRGKREEGKREGQFSASRLSNSAMISSTSFVEQLQKFNQFVFVLSFIILR